MKEAHHPYWLKTSCFGTSAVELSSGTILYDEDFWCELLHMLTVTVTQCVIILSVWFFSYGLEVEIVFFSDLFYNNHKH